MVQGKTPVDKQVMRTLSFLLLAGAASAMTVTTPAKKIPSDGFVRDAEKKHARVAMLALPALAILGTFDPEPVTWLSRQPVDVQALFFSGAAAVEALASFPRLGPEFSLREDVYPGNFFGLPLPGENATAVEDVIGRVAMLSAAGALLAGLQRV